MTYNDDFLSGRLNERKQQHFHRHLQLPGEQIDFCSNDYLGIIRNRLLRNRPTGLHTGSGGTRLLSGNYRLIEEVEERIAAFHEAEAAVIFSSGYDANIGVLSSVPQSGDTLLYDELCHTSVKDGAALSKATSISFAHNDVNDLQQKLSSAKGNIFVFTESVFDTDGSMAPLENIFRACGQYKAHVIVNESHSIGVYGEKGEGLVHEAGLEELVFARIHGFGNACGSHGAVVMGSLQLKDFLLNFCNPLMHSTTLSEQTVSTIWEAYKVLPQLWQERAHLNNLIATFRDADLPFQKLNSLTPIQHILVNGPEAAKHMSEQLRAAGYDVRPVFYPSVPKGEERVRIVLHSFNTRGELSWLIHAINALRSVKEIEEGKTAANSNAA